ncbi:MAG: hypothetical protein JWP01_3376 [Myxococcales bacterium]|nr:hypothetical protein [Myxococcales bacterium]
MTELRNLGTEIPFGSLGTLRPVDVLDELERPMLFTSRLPTLQLALVYWVDEDDEGDVRLVVPTEESIVMKLFKGEVTIREALKQPWAWLSFGSTIRSIKLDDLPDDCLPQSGVYLQPEFAPLLSVRFTGDIEENYVAASVIGRATEAVRGALKPILDFLTKSDPEGRPTNNLRRLYDLPTRRMAYGSLEVDFGSPTQLDLLDDEKKLMNDAAGLLQKGLAWATTPNARPPADDDDEWTAILAALRHLVPPGTGAVQNVEIDGKLARRKISLNRKATKNVIHALKTRGKPRAVQLEGYVREFDRDKLTFTLRTAPHVTAGESRCYCDETLADDVDYAFDAGHAVLLVGQRERNWIEAVFITELAADPPTEG